MRSWQCFVVCLAIFSITLFAQEVPNSNQPATNQSQKQETAEQMRKRFLELARQRADEMTIDELQFKVGELNRELKESEAEKHIKQIDEMLSKLIKTYPDTFAARRAATALTALREPPSRLPPRVSISGSSRTTEGEQVEQVINIDALQRRLRQGRPNDYAPR